MNILTNQRVSDRVVTVHVETGADGVGRITLDRPEAKNALTRRDARRDRRRGARGARPTPTVRALLITATGDAFCAGMDLSASTVAQGRPSPASTRARTAEALRVGVQAFIRELWELDKPTVAAVNGAAVGPGRAPRARVRLRARAPARRGSCGRSHKWGLVVDAGGAYLLPRLVGLPRAKAMVMLGEGCTGAGGRRPRARVPLRRPADELAGAADELAARLAAGPTRVARAVEAAAQRELRDRPRRAASTSRARTSRSPPTSTDLVEGMAAFKERRDPNFTGT